MAKKKKEQVDAPRKRGRPTLFRAEYIPIAGRLARDGHTYFEIAQYLGVDQGVFYGWRQRYPELEKVLLIDSAAANNRVEMSLYHQAVGYERDEEEIKVIEGKIHRVKIRRFYPPNGPVAIYWSKAKMGWRDDGMEPTVKDDTAQIEGTGIQTQTIRQTARAIAFILHQGGKKEAS